MNGIIALDIDGTLTTNSQAMPPRVAAYLAELVHKGWRLLFITGRSFGSCQEMLKPITFSYYLAVQNGAIILHMPERKIVSKKYLSKAVFATMEQICHNDPSDFVVYSGIEHGDITYYRPSYFSETLLDYIQRRKTAFKENWVPLPSYDSLHIEEFPSIKCFGHYSEALRLTQEIEKHLNLHVPLIRDPFDEEYYVVQATYPGVDKGQAFRDLIALIGQPGHLIAAGDDLNDLPMLDVATTKIVMATAPASMLANATIIAPPATEEGIIPALQSIIK